MPNGALDGSARRRGSNLCDDSGSAGEVLQLSAEMQAQGARPAWVCYLHVGQVDAALAAITADGGRALSPTMTLPVGDIAMVADPLGARFGIVGHQGD